MFEKIISKNQDEPKGSASAPASFSKPAAAPSTAPTSASTPATSSSAASSKPGNGQRNILSNDVSITGSVRFANDLLLDGKIEGEIASEGALTVAENAVIKAEIKTKSVIIYGKVHGNIVAGDRVEIKNGAEMVGDVKAALLSVEPGAIFVGKSEVGNPSAQPQQSSAPTPQGNIKKPQQQKPQQQKPQQQKPQQQSTNASVA